MAYHYPKGSRSTPARHDGAGDMDVGSSFPDAARAAVDDLLAGLDRELPGRIEGFYVVGSTCLGAFRADRSDVDFVAVVADGGRSTQRELPGEVRYLRLVTVRAATGQIHVRPLELGRPRRDGRADGGRLRH